MLVVLADVAEVVVVVDEVVAVGTVVVVVELVEVVGLVALVVEVVVVVVVAVGGKLAAHLASKRRANLDTHIEAEDAPGVRHIAATMKSAVPSTLRATALSGWRKLAATCTRLR